MLILVGAKNPSVLKKQNKLRYGKKKSTMTNKVVLEK